MKISQTPYRYWNSILKVLYSVRVLYGVCIVSKENDKDSWSDWVAWLFYAFILALMLHPIRRLIFSDTYEKMSQAQEILLFGIIVTGLAIFVVRPFAKSFREKGK